MEVRGDWGGGVYLSHARWFGDVLVTLFTSLDDDRGNEKLLKCCKSMRSQRERRICVCALSV